MDTRGKTNVEFRNDVSEILACHELSFDQVNANLQPVLTELQTLRILRSSNTVNIEINPFAPVESSHNPNQPSPSCHGLTIDRPITISNCHSQSSTVKIQLELVGFAKHNNTLTSKILPLTNKFN